MRIVYCGFSIASFLEYQIRHAGTSPKRSQLYHCSSAIDIPQSQITQLSSKDSDFETSHPRFRICRMLYVQMDHSEYARHSSGRVIQRQTARAKRPGAYVQRQLLSQFEDRNESHDLDGGAEVRSSRLRGKDLSSNGKLHRAAEPGRRFDDERVPR